MQCAYAFGYTLCHMLLDIHFDFVFSFLDFALRLLRLYKFIFEFFGWLWYMHVEYNPPGAFDFHCLLHNFAFFFLLLCVSLLFYAIFILFTESVSFIATVFIFCCWCYWCFVGVFICSVVC